jgi:hypothetical protein
MNYENGPSGMSRVPRLPDAVIECLIRHSMFRDLANRYDGEDRDRLFGLIHDVAEEVLARVELPKTAPAQPAVGLVAAIEAVACRPRRGNHPSVIAYRAGHRDALAAAAALARAQLEGK